MPTNARQFKKTLAEVAKRLTATELVLLHRRIALDALRRVIMKTPVDTGRTRANWQLSIGVVATSKLEAKDRGGTDTLSRNISKLVSLGPFQVVYISNNVDHIEVLEDGLFQPPDPGPSKDKRKGRKGEVLVRGGFSVQAPQGMVKVTIQEILAEYA